MLRPEGDSLNDKNTVTDRAVFASDHGFRKVAVTWGPRSGGRGRGAQFVDCLGIGAGFSLVKDSGDREFSVKSLDSDFQAKLRYEQKFGRYLSAPYSVLGFPLTGIMKNAGFRLKSVAKKDEAGRPCYAVNYENGESAKPDRVSLLLDPALGWAIRSGEVRTGFNDWQSRIAFKTEYFPVVDGLALPRSVEFYDLSGKTSLCTVDRIESGPTPRGEFSTAFYGRPDLDTRGPEVRGTRLMPWFVGAGVAGVAVALWTLKRSASAAKQPAGRGS